MSEELTDDERFSGLPKSVVDAAKQAHCARCKEQVVESQGLSGTIMLNYYVPLLGVKMRAILCGPCGLGLREYLSPEILDDPQYLAVRDELRVMWG